MARSLVLEYTTDRDLVVDPFCGSGVLALEAAAAGRNIVAGDLNPYAVLLTRAKLFAPANVNLAKTELQSTWVSSREKLRDQDLRRVPRWVRSFFHPDTLRSALAFRDTCMQTQSHFLLACLLGILHHERPGFLSKPSSHLVPYLRDQKYPRDRFPEMYEPRDVFTRLDAKVTRAYKRPVNCLPNRRVILERDARTFPRVRKIGAVITSPPYMNELDYIRDNRLRLWFIERSLPPNLDLVHRDRLIAFRELLTTVCKRLAGNVIPGGRFVLVVGDATRGRGTPGRTGEITRQVFASEERLKHFALEKVYEDIIPDVRRSRRECRGTKGETILVFKKTGN